MKHQKWFAVSVLIKPEFSEAAEFAFNEHDSLGNEIDSLGKTSGEPVAVKGYFHEPPDAESFEKTLQTALAIYGFPADSAERISIEEIENQDWLAEWKKHWKATETEKFIIAPPWENIEDKNKILIRIEPNMAFGTGTHETTKLCLKAIEENYESGMSFFDVGTGTGILAIAASKTAAENAERKIFNKKETSKSSVSSVAKKILACDTDEDSIKIAKENAKLNNAEKIEFFVGSISEETPKFDFVCANVTADVIIPILPLLIKKTKKFLVLSGILSEQKPLILEALNNFGLKNPFVRTDGEWISVTIKF